MHILALDTTGRSGSVAVARDATVLHAFAGDAARTHGERLPADIMRALDAAAIRVQDLDLLAVAAGPGSFTGLRVGISAIQGLAVARGLQVVPVPTLEALARAAGDLQDADLVAPWMDGQRGEVFAALFGAQGPGPGSRAGIREIHAATAAAPGAVLDEWALGGASRVVCIGDGAVRYRPILEERLGARAAIRGAPPLAPVLARIAFDAPFRAVSPHEIVPVYVRRSDAEIARDRARTAGASSAITPADDAPGR